MNPTEEIKKLVSYLNEQRHAYYNENSPNISDAEYDQQFDRLKYLEEKTGFILYNSPTQTVGYEPVSELPKVVHPIPLLSLDKTKLVQDLLADRGRRPLRIRSAEPASGGGHNRRIALPPTRFRRRRARRSGALRPRNIASASTLVQRRGRQRGQPASVRKGGISPLRPSPRLASGRRRRTHRRDPFSENSR